MDITGNYRNVITRLCFEEACGLASVLSAFCFFTVNSHSHSLKKSLNLGEVLEKSLN